MKQNDKAVFFFILGALALFGGQGYLCFFFGVLTFWFAAE